MGTKLACLLPILIIGCSANDISSGVVLVTDPEVPPSQRRLLGQAATAWNLEVGTEITVAPVGVTPDTEANVARVFVDALVCGWAGAVADYEIAVCPQALGNHGYTRNLFRHELGHILGLGHTEDPNATMFSDGVNSDFLNETDRQLFFDVHPQWVGRGGCHVAPPLSRGAGWAAVLPRPGGEDLMLWLRYSVANLSVSGALETILDSAPYERWPFFRLSWSVDGEQARLRGFAGDEIVRVDVDLGKETIELLPSVSSVGTATRGFAGRETVATTGAKMYAARSIRGFSPPYNEELVLQEFDEADGRQLQMTVGVGAEGEVVAFDGTVFLLRLEVDEFYVTSVELGRLESGVFAGEPRLTIGEALDLTAVILGDDERVFAPQVRVMPTDRGILLILNRGSESFSIVRVVTEPSLRVETTVEIRGTLGAPRVAIREVAGETHLVALLSNRREHPRPEVYHRVLDASNLLPTSEWQLLSAPDGVGASSPAISVIEGQPHAQWRDGSILRRRCIPDL